MQIHQVPIERVKPATYNPRNISDQGFEGLKESLKKFGLVTPLVINTRTDTLVGGHQRLKAMESIGHKEVPVVYVDMSPAEEKALNIALNNPQTAGTFDVDLLKELLVEIKDEEMTSDLDHALNFDSLAADLNIFFDDEPEEPEILGPGDAEDKANLSIRIKCSDMREYEFLKEVFQTDKPIFDEVLERVPQLQQAYENTFN